MERRKEMRGKLSTRILALIMAVLIVVTGINVPGLNLATRAYAEEAGEGGNTSATSWRELQASPGAGLKKISWDGGMNLNNLTANATGADRFINRYADISGDGKTITFPTGEDLPNPSRYQDQNGDPNTELKGWLLVPPVSAWKNEDGSYRVLPESEIHYYEPGATETINESFIGDDGSVRFLADWGPKSYDYGFADDTKRGGIRDDLVSEEGIQTHVYDINAAIYNVLYARYQGGNWYDNHTGPVFIDTNQGAGSWGKSIYHMADKDWAYDTGDGYTSLVNNWNKGKISENKEGASQGLWDAFDFKSIFNDDTIGVTYVGTASKGPMFWREKDASSRFNGYYVYDSKESAAVFNQKDEKFYVYKQPQGINTSNKLAYLPFNAAQNWEYSYLDGSVNYHFATHTEVDFFLTGTVPSEVPEEGAKKTNQIEVDGEMKDMQFYFSGDDDVFVFVDGELVLDIGGIHDAVEGTINFATGEVKTRRVNGANQGTFDVENNSSIAGLTRGNHKLEIYYIERGASESNNMTAFLLTVPTHVRIQKMETQTGEPAVFKGAQFYLMDEDGNYYELDNPDAVAPAVPQVRFGSKENATVLEADDNGVVEMKYLVDGKYRLVEIGAPDYYEGLPGAFDFTLTNSKIDNQSLTFDADTEYHDPDRTWTSEDWAEHVEVVENKEVHLEVSNDRKTKPLVMKKRTDDGKTPEGVIFNFYELQKAPTLEDGKTIDFAAIQTDAVPTEVRHVYQGTTNADGVVTNYTWWPKGKNTTPAAEVETGLEYPSLKEGAVYYIVEDYFDEDYHVFKTPIVVTVTEEGVVLVSDIENDQRFNFEGVKTVDWNGATVNDNGEAVYPTKDVEDELDVINVSVTTEDPIKKVNDNDQQKDKVDGEGNPVYKVDEENNQILDKQGNPIQDKEWDETQIEVLPARDTVFTYTITQKVPANTSKMVITDVLEDVLEVVGKPTINPNPYGVFNVKVNGNTVVATGDDSTINGVTPLMNMGDHETEVTLTIRAKIKAGVTDDDLKAKYGGTTDIPNTAKVKINDRPELETNVVKVTPPPEIENPVKSIKESTTPDKDELKLVGRRHEYTYEIEQNIPVRTKTIKVEDILENVLEFAGTKDDVVVQIVDGENVTTLTEEDDTVKITQSGQKLTVEISGKAAEAAGNNKIHVEFKARIKENITDAELLKLYKDENGDPTTSIPNTATVTIDNTQKVTNEVEVTPPPTPEKRVDGDVHKVLGNATDEIPFEIKQFVPKDATSLSFSDTLSTMLDFVGTYKVEAEDPLTEAKTEVTSGTVGETDEKLEFTLSDTDLAKVQGKIAVVTFSAKFNKDAMGIDGKGEITEAKLEEIKANGDVWVKVNDNGAVQSSITEHEGIANKAELTVGAYNTGKFTNEVTVTPPTNEPGGLDVKKQVKPLAEMTDELANKKFSFTVEFTAAEGSELPANVKFAIKAAVATADPEDSDYQDMAISGGKISFELAHGETAMIKGLPNGTTYKVTEEADDAFTTDIASGEGTVVSGISKEATAINTEKEPPAPGNLDIMKIVNGDADDAEFTFEVTLTKAADAEDINYEEIMVSIAGGEAAPATVEGGKIVVTVKKGETAHITGIPNGTTYKVEEKNTIGYELESLANNSGTITSNNTVTAVAINNPEPQENPHKEVGAAEDATSEELLKLEERQQEYYYAITQDVPGYTTKIKFEDKIENVLKFADDPEIKLYNGEETVEVQVVDAVPENAEAGVYAVISGQTLTVTVLGDDAKAFRSNIAKLTFKAQLREEFSDADLIKIYGDTNIPNKATVEINDNPKSSNEVEVTPPPTSQKTIRNDVHAVLANADETFDYAITMFIPEDAESVEVSDNLSEFLVIDNVNAQDAITVLANDVNVARSTYRETKDDKSLLIEFIDVSAVAGKTLTVKFNAKFDPTLIDSNGELTPAALERIEAAYGQVPADENGTVNTNVGDHEGIINDANVKLNGNDNPTNKVTVIPPSTEPGTLTVKKTLHPENDKTEITEEDLAAEFNFTVDFTDENDALLAADILANVTVKVNDQLVEGAVDASASKATFTLKADEEAFIEGLPGGTKYVVTEEALAEDSAYKQGTTFGTNGSILSTTNKDAEVQNIKKAPPQPGDLSVLKAVSGTVPAGEEEREFEFEVELTDEEGNIIAPRSIEGLLLNGAALASADVREGKIVFKLKANEQADITGIPVGTSYAVSEVTEGLVTFELDTDNQVNWTGTIGDNDKITAVFINKPVTPPTDPKKTINGKEHEDLSAKDTPFTYVVTQFVPIGTKTVTFEDNLNGQLRYVGNASVSGGNLRKNLAPEGQTLAFELTPEEIALIEGNIMTVTFNARYTDEATDETIEGSYVDVNAAGEEIGENTEDKEVAHTGTPNQAKTKIGDHEANTNVVTVTAPPDVPNPEKGFNEEGKLVDYVEDPQTGELVAVEPKLELTGRNQTFTYFVEQTIPAGITLKSLSFTDDIQSVLEFVPATNANAKIFDMTVGDEIESDIVISGQKITATPKSLEGLAGKTLRFSFDAKIKTGVTDEQLIGMYESTDIPNTATVNINNSPFGTNEALVTPPPTDETPEKEVNGVKDADTSTTDVIDAVKIANRNDSFTYTISQKVPASTESKKVTSLVFEDELEEVLKVVGENGEATLTYSVTVVDETTGESSVETKTIEGAGVQVKVTEANGRQKLTATVSDGELLQNELQNKTVTLTFKAQIKEDVTDETLYGKYRDKTLDVPNDAVVTVKVNDEGTGRTTNEVWVTPPPEEPEEPEKFVEGVKAGTDDAATEAPLKLAKRPDTFTYTVTQKVPALATNVQFIDNLHHYLEVVAVDGVKQAFLKDGDTVIKEASVRVVGNLVMATLSDEAKLAELTNKTLTLEIEAKLRDNVTDEQLMNDPQIGVNREIPNEATVVIGNSSKTTNEVKVVPPEEPEEPEKFINDQQTMYSLKDRPEEFKYTITQKVPANADTLTFEDVLEPVLEVVKNEDGSYKVEINGLSEYGEIKVEPETSEDEPDVTYTKVSVGTDDATNDRDKEVTLTIWAKIKDGIEDEELIERYGTTVIPNYATVLIDDEPLVTNTVNVTPPPVPSDEPEKTVGADADNLIEVEKDENGHVTNKPNYELPEAAEGETPEEARTKTFTYAVSQKVPSGAVTLGFEDTLESVLTFVPEGTANAKITASAEVEGEVVTEDVTSKAEIKIDGQKITATFSDEATVKTLVGKTVNFTFDARIKDNISDSELIAKYKTSNSIPNTARVLINGNPKTTNEVLVTPPPAPGKDPEKGVEGMTADGQVIPALEGKLELEKRTDTFTYTVTQEVLDDCIKVIFTDTVEPVLEIVGTPTLKDAEGNDVELTEDGIVISPNKRTITATVKDNEAQGTPGEEGYVPEKSVAAGKTITLTFQAKVKAGVTDAELIRAYGETKEIPNVATVSMNDNAKVTNEVTVTPPPVVREDPTKDVEGIDENGEPIPALGETEDSIKLMNRKDTFTFTVRQVIPDGAINVQFDDVLERVLEVVGTPVVTVDDEVIAEATVRSGRIVSATIADATEYAQKTMVLTIHAKIKDGVTDEQLMAMYEGTRDIPNEATVTIDGDGKVTNEVKVTPPEEPEDPTKTINDTEAVTLEAAEITSDMTDEAKAEAIRAAREKEFTYKVEQLIPENADTVTITDEVEDVLAVIEGSEAVVVTDAEGNEVTVEPAWNVSGNTVEVTISGIQEAGLAKGTVVLSFNAKIVADDATLMARVKDAKYEKDYSGTTTVPNKAQVKFDFDDPEDDPRYTNTVEVTPPPTPSDEPVKKVNGKDNDKLVQAEGETLEEARTKEFEYTITQVVPAGCAKLEFEDTLASVLEAGEITLTDEDGNVVAEPTTAEVDVVENGVEGKATRVTAVSTDAEKLAGLAGKTVTLTIKAHIKEGVRDSELIAKFGNTAIPNKATVKINGDPKSSNEVKITPPDEPGEKPVKKVKGETGIIVDETTGEPILDENGNVQVVAAKLENRTEQFEYTVSQVLPSEVTKVSFTDKVESVLVIDAASAKILGSENAEAYKIEVNGQTITAVAEDASADAGKEITLSFMASLKPGTTDQQLIDLYGEAMEIPNTATVTIDDSSKVTNEVKVTPPPTDRKDPKKGVEGIDADGNVIPAIEEEVKLTNRNQDIVYTITQEIPAGAVNVQFADILEHVLTTSKDNIKVEVEGKAVEGATISVIRNRVVTVTVTDATAYADKEMVVTIKANIRDDITDADIIKEYGEARQIPNEATVVIDGNGKGTNEVLVTPPGDPEEPKKTINEGTELVTLGARDEVFEYAVTQVVPENAKTVTITDTIEPELIFVDNAGQAQKLVEGEEDAVAVVDNRNFNAANTGNASAGKISIEGKTIKVEIEDATELRGETVTLTFKAAIDPAVTDAQLLKREGTYNKTTVIPNKAEVKFDFSDEPLMTNTVEVTPPPTPSEEPKKEIKESTEENKDFLELAERTDEFTYEISQVIPAGAVNVVFEDTLADVLEVVSTEMSADGFTVTVDPETVDAATESADKRTAQKVTATIDDATELADQTVTLTIVAKMKEGVTDKELIAKYKSTQVANKATIKINGNPNTTNEVRVTPPPTPGENPVKKVNEKNHEDLASKYSEFTYTVTQKLPEDAETIEFTDTVESILEIIGEPTVTGGEAEYEVKVSEDKRTVTATCSDASADANKDITLTFTAKIRKGTTEDQIAAFTDRKIPNKATVTVNDNPKISNEVTVTPPTPTEEEPDKKVNGQNEYKLVERNEEFVYTVSQKIPDGAVNVVFEDTLERVLEITDTDFSIEGIDVNVNGRKVSATIADATEYSGQTVVLTIYAKIREDVTDAELVKFYGDAKEVPNEATVTIDGKPKTTHEVKVTPPDEPEPEKTVSKPVLTTRDEVFTYTVTKTIPTGAVNVVFSDTLEDVLEVKSAVLSTGQAAIVDGNRVSATIEDATELAGQDVTLTIEAAIRAGISDEELIRRYGDAKQIPNVATVTIDGRPQVTNEVLVTPPPEEPPTPEDPVKKVGITPEQASTNPHTMINRNDSYVYTVTQLIPENAEEVIIQDTLVPELEFTGDYEINDSQANVQFFDANNELTEDIASARTIMAVISNCQPEVDPETGEVLTEGMAGQEVTLVFGAKIKADVTDEELIAKYGYAKLIPNDATAKFDFEDEPRTSNTVVVTPPPEEPEVPEEPVKTVSDADEKDVNSATLANRDETFVYTVSQVIPRGAVNVTFTDTLERVLDIKNCSINVEGVVPVAKGQTVTATIEDARALAGQTVVLTIEAAINPEVTDAELIRYYGDAKSIPNEATVTIDGKGQTTNEVLVTPPDEPEPEPEYVSTSVEKVWQNAEGKAIKWPAKVASVTVTVTYGTESETLTLTEAEPKQRTKAFEKVEGASFSVTESAVAGFTTSVSGNGDAGFTVTNKLTPPDEPVKTVSKTQLESRDEMFSYSVSQKLPAAVTKVEFTDTLEEVLTFNGVPRITTADGTVVAEGPSDVFVIDGQKITATIEDASAYAGDTLTLTFGAVIKPDVTDEKLVEKYGEKREIPNKATVTIDGNPQGTNEVKVIPPPPEVPEEPVKTVSKTELENRFEMFSYSVSQKLPKNVKSVMFEDTLEDVLEFVGVPTITTADGTVVAEGPSDVFVIDGQKITATIEDASAYAGDTLTLTFGAVIKAGTTDAELIAKYGEKREIPNKATVSIDGKPQGTNEVKVIPPPPGVPEEPEKTVSKAELEARDEIFSYSVSQKIPEGAINLVFEDTLEDVLEFVGVPRITLADGTVVAEGPSDVFVIDGQKITATIADASGYAGDTLTLTFGAVIKSDVTDEQLIAKYGETREIPNKATVTIDGNPQATNEVKVVPPPEEVPEVTSVNVTKVWDDNDNLDGSRPTSVKFYLLANGVRTGDEVTLSVSDQTSNNTWTRKNVFTDLPVYDEAGNRIAYSVEEEAIAFYLPDMQVQWDVANGYYEAVATNVHRPWFPEIPGTPGAKFTVKKTVSGTAELDKDYVIMVKFTLPEGKVNAEGKNVYTETLTLKPTDTAYEFEYVMVGTKVEVMELTTGYTTTYTVNGATGGEFTAAENGEYAVVVNNHKEPTTPTTPNVPTTPKTPTTPNTPTRTTTTPKTGDANDMMAWLGLMGLAAALTTAVAVRRRKASK